MVVEILNTKSTYNTLELTSGRITYDGPGRDHDHDIAQENRP